MPRDIDEQRLQELLDQKLSEREIARQLDVPRTTLKRHLEKSKSTLKVHQEVHIPDQLTAIQDDLIEIAAWWRERRQLTQTSTDPERETERKTYHIEKRHIAAIERAADLERVSITEIVNRAFAHFFSKM